MKETDISIIIVNYNSKTLLQECLDSIINAINVNYEVIIVDNNSTDDSFLNAQNRISDERFKFIKSNSNLGFAKANNLGYKYAKGTILHFLNPDTIINRNLNNDYRLIIESPDNVYIHKLVNLDGSRENTKHLIPTFKNTLCSLFCSNKTQFWYIGASVIISISLFEKIGLWNENYFMYSEDLDLFYRINLYQIPIKEFESHIVHIGKGSSTNVWNNFERELVIEESYYRFFKINRSIREYFLVQIITFIYLLFKTPRKFIFKIKTWLYFLRKKKKF